MLEWLSRPEVCRERKGANHFRGSDRLLARWQHRRDRTRVLRSHTGILEGQSEAARPLREL